MQHLAAELLQTVGSFAAQLRTQAEPRLTARPAPGKWSAKEIVGHLVDSAQNNIQRFVRAQYEPAMAHIVYRQDDWVRLQHYQTYPSAELIRLWVLLNRHLGHIWRHMDAAAGALPYTPGPAGAPEILTLEALAVDYLRHLRHHLAAIEQQLR